MLYLCSLTSLLQHFEVARCFYFAIFTGEKMRFRGSVAKGIHLISVGARTQNQVCLSSERMFMTMVPNTVPP